MTEKLYYKDAYLSSFNATVIDCQEREGAYAVVLDSTAFFPEEGGQYSDTGRLSDARVSRVTEEDGIIYHLSDKPLLVGSVVEGVIDFDERYEKMQCHTAEHILSGLINKKYGYSNVGFHLGADEVTMDISAPLSRDELLEIELLANEVVFKNVPVCAIYPDAEEAMKMQYRSKLDITENLRIVNIGEYDSCACCAPHVSATGEIGSIKIVDFTGLRGGTRIFITAGRRALRYFRSLFDNLAVISHALSVPKTESAAAFEKYVLTAEEAKNELKQLQKAYFEREADIFPESDNTVVKIFNGATQDQMRAFANKAVSKVDGILVLLSPSSEDVKYIIASQKCDLRGEMKKINAALEGRGGGSAVMAQGSFKASPADIEKYFLENYCSHSNESTS